MRRISGREFSLSAPSAAMLAPSRPPCLVGALMAFDTSCNRLTEAQMLCLIALSRAK